MLGRALFAVVCLIIAAGLVLPIYPAELEVARPVAAGAQDIGRSPMPERRGCPAEDRAARPVLTAGRCLTA